MSEFIRYHRQHSIRKLLVAFFCLQCGCLSTKPDVNLIGKIGEPCSPCFGDGDSPGNEECVTCTSLGYDPDKRQLLVCTESNPTWHLDYECPGGVSLRCVHGGYKVHCLDMQGNEVPL